MTARERGSMVRRSCRGSAVRPAEIRVSFETVSAGRIAFYEGGTGPTVVFIHGMFGDHLDWEPILEPLSRSHRVLAPDLPGFGESAKPERDYTEEFFLGALEELLAQRDAKKVTLVGNSFGGELAVLYALAHPERVEGLVLVSSGGLRVIPEREKREVEERFNAATLARLTPAMQEMIFAPVFARHEEQWRHYLDKQNSKLKRPDFPAYARALERSIHLALSIYVADRLPELACPTLLVWGDEDRVLPLDLAREAVAKLRQGSLVVLLGCGHAPQLDDPEGFCRALADFLDGPA